MCTVAKSLSPPDLGCEGFVWSLFLKPAIRTYSALPLPKTQICQPFSHSTLNLILGIVKTVPECAKSRCVLVAILNTLTLLGHDGAAIDIEAVMYCRAMSWRKDDGSIRLFDQIGMVWSLGAPEIVVAIIGGEAGISGSDIF